MSFHLCWTIDCESTRKEIGDVNLGENAIYGFAELLEQRNWRGTFFLVPGEVEPFADLLKALSEKGHEIALHLHPDELSSEGPYLGSYSGAAQEAMIRQAQDHFEKHLGTRPVSFRPGFCSANDATFVAMNRCGVRQASASMPGRRMTTAASHWAGAPLFSHYANPHNRFLSGGLDLVEIPISVDWESMIWGGIHPQDLRVEFTDSKNHGFLIEKIMKRQVHEGLPFKALVVLTHNLFRFADTGDFRRTTMLGMMDSMERVARALKVDTAGTTLAAAAAAFRSAVPFHD